MKKDLFRKHKGTNKSIYLFEDARVRNEADFVQRNTLKASTIENFKGLEAKNIIYQINPLHENDELEDISSDLYRSGRLASIADLDESTVNIFRIHHNCSSQCLEYKSLGKILNQIKPVDFEYLEHKGLCLALEVPVYNSRGEIDSLISNKITISESSP